MSPRCSTWTGRGRHVHFGRRTAGQRRQLRIRGFGSINARTPPLLVVDGVPFDGDLNSINSSDIESMSVLKDASAGALYRARGASGVILITTKRERRTGRIASVSLSARWASVRGPFPLTTRCRPANIWSMYLACYNDPWSTRRVIFRPWPRG